MSDGFFVARQLARMKPLWDTMLGHRVLRETRDATVPDDTFATCMRQDHLFVEAALAFVKELEVLEDRAAVVNVDLRTTPPSFTNHAWRAVRDGL